jgi:hypothetical protein
VFCFNALETGGALVPCSVGASTGHLYMLERSLFFIDKPAINIMYEHIEQVEFQRHSQITTNRNFDLEVKLRGNKTVMLGGRPKGTVTFRFCFLRKSKRICFSKVRTTVILLAKSELRL